MFLGTTVSATVVRVIDGDTIRLSAEGREESIRMLALDTEESNAGSDKPITPWGRKAKEEAARLFAPGDTAVLEFPGTEPLAECWTKHRDNYDRVLGFVHKDGQDFQEHMIIGGYSPYFIKYGYVPFTAYHERYNLAERAAQSAHLGLWDQLTVNGSEARNYALLGVWWRVRAELVERYRRIRLNRPDLFDTRLDYARLLELAPQQPEVTVFTELREYHRVGSRHVVVTIGSIAQPFQVFIPDAVISGQTILQLLDNRYVTKEPHHVRGNYAYVTGVLKLFEGRPEITVNRADQITDEPPDV